MAGHTGGEGCPHPPSQQRKGPQGPSLVNCLNQRWCQSLTGSGGFHALLDKAVLGRPGELLVRRRLLALGRLVGGPVRLQALLHEAVLGSPGQLLVGGRFLTLACLGTGGGILDTLAHKAGLGCAVKLFGCGLRLALQLGSVVGKDRIGQQHAAAEQAEQDGTLHG